MSQPPALPTLLALLLAIRDPDVTLNSDEQEELFTIGEQLQLNPEMRDKTQAKLMSVIQSNPKLTDALMVDCSVRDRTSNTSIEEIKKLKKII